MHNLAIFRRSVAAKPSTVEISGPRALPQNGGARYPLEPKT